MSVDSTTVDPARNPFAASLGCANLAEATGSADGTPSSGLVGAGGVRPYYDAEGVTLILGNCLDYLPIIADAVVSDPPYGMNLDTDNSRFTAERHSTTNGKRNAGKHDGLKVLEDDQPFDPSPWLKYPAVVLFGSNHYAARLPVGTTLVWLKRNDAGFGTFLSDAEVAWMKGGHGVYAKRDLSMNGEALTRCHPCQKPVALMAWVMERAKVPAGATVLDPYMGSGSTGLAAIRTGRKFIGIERDPVHFASAVQRIRAELAQGVLSLGGGGAEQVSERVNTRPDSHIETRSATRLTGSVTEGENNEPEQV